MGAGKVRHYLFRFSWGTKISSLLRSPPLRPSPSAPLLPSLLPGPWLALPARGTQDVLGSCAVLGGSLDLGLGWVLGSRGPSSESHHS